MKNLSLCFTIVFCWIFLQACKKDNKVEPKPDTKVEVKPFAFKDSVSFTINQDKYVFDDWLGFGSANYAVNVKKSAVKLADKKLAYESGGYYWYGAGDSTLYAARSTMFSNTLGYFEIGFAKKFKDSEMVRRITLLYPQSHDQVFKTGEFGFAVDLEKENTMEGVAFEFYEKKLNSILSTKILQSSTSDVVTKKDIQSNSSFNITKVEKTKEGLYIIEARFELNLFDKNNQLYRVKNGFLKIATPTFYN